MIFESIIGFSLSNNITSQIPLFREKYETKFLARQRDRGRGFHVRSLLKLCLNNLLKLYTPPVL